MILLYHKVAPDSPTQWWVTVDDFYRQLCELSCRRVVYLDDYDPADPEQVVISFDGIYHNVWEFARPLLAHFGLPFELFLSSDYIGRDNAFDHSEPRAEFASLHELQELVLAGGRLQWHSRSHPRLDQVSAAAWEHELAIPAELRALDPAGWRWFAYPHGAFTPELQGRVRESFAGALSCEQGSLTDRYAWPRVTAESGSCFGREKISVIVPCYNYGAYLIEAVESVLRQSRPPDELLISDDCSTDHSFAIAQDLEQQFPGTIKVNRNSKNLGIVDHFNQALAMTSGGYVCLLGADNRFLSNYLEKCAGLLDREAETAIVYTDFALFGPRAKLVYQGFQVAEQGPVVADRYYVVKFPQFDQTARRRLLEATNFIHGSALFRRRAFEQVGGYRKDSGAPEDQNLFRRIVAAGWGAQKVSGTFLEYRQHSAEQANIAFDARAQLNFYQQKYTELIAALKQRDAQIAGQEQALREKRELLFKLKEGNLLRQPLPPDLARRVQRNGQEMLQAAFQEAWRLCRSRNFVAGAEIAARLLPLAQKYGLRPQELHYLNAVCYFQLGRWPEAQQALRQELLLNPQHQGAMVLQMAMAQATVPSKQ